MKKKANCFVKTLGTFTSAICQNLLARADETKVPTINILYKIYNTFLYEYAFTVLKFQMCLKD